MATNLDIEPELLTAAVEAGQHKTKRAAVEAALREYVNRRRQRKVLELFGEIDYNDTYDYKEARKRGSAKCRFKSIPRCGRLACDDAIAWRVLRLNA